MSKYSLVLAKCYKIWVLRNRVVLPQLKVPIYIEQTKSIEDEILVSPNAWLWKLRVSSKQPFTKGSWNNTLLGSDKNLVYS